MSAFPGFQADWWDFVFLHYAVEPDRVAALTSFPLDLREGRAFVSLVFFRLERMRFGPPVPAWIGEKLCRPISDHFFLNFRIYVRGPAGPGIQFLAEWVDNPLSRVLGPATYGLPYRRADFHREIDACRRKFRFAVRDRENGAKLSWPRKRKAGRRDGLRVGWKSFCWNVTPRTRCDGANGAGFAWSIGTGCCDPRRRSSRIADSFTAPGPGSPMPRFAERMRPRASRT